MTNAKATLSARTQDAGTRMEEDGFVKVDSARKVEYLLSNTVFDVVEITVRGWWLGS
jgi:hypothetical protein